MIYLSEILPAEIISAIGWTLLHTLWQGIAIAMLLAIFLFILRKKSAQTRYAFSFVAMLMMVLAVIVTFTIEYQTYHSISETLIFPAVETPSTLQTSLIAENWFTPFLNYFNENIPLLVLVWVTGIFFLGVKMIGELTYLNHLKTYRTQQVPEALYAQLNRISTQLNIVTQVQILESLKVKTPMVVGMLKPVILLPFGLISGFTPKQIECILAHELAHIKRYDFAINLFQSLIEVLLFFNPAVWWISACIRAERENCCDDLAIEVVGDKAIFVKTLARLEELRHSSSNSLAMTFSKNNNGVLHRIRRILKKETTYHAFSKGFWGSLILIVSFFFASFTVEDTPQNDVENPPIDSFEVIENEPFEEKIEDVSSDITAETLPTFSLPETISNTTATPKKLPESSLKKFESPQNTPVKEKISSSVKTDTVPDDSKSERELQLLEKRIIQLRQSLERHEREIAQGQNQRLQDFENEKAQREAEINFRAEELDRQNSYLENEMKQKMKLQQEQQMLELEQSFRKLAAEEEKLMKFRVAEMEKKLAQQKPELDNAMKKMELQMKTLESKKDQLSSEEYQEKKIHLEQQKQEIAQYVEVEMKNQKELLEMEIKQMKMNLHFEREQLELQKKQIDLNTKQMENELEKQRAEMARAKMNLAAEIRALENYDIEKLRREMAEHKRRVAEEMEMLQMELKVLENEKRRRIE